MKIDEILNDLQKLEDLISDLKFATEIARDQGQEVERAIRDHTRHDPNLLGAALNLAALL